MSSDGAWLLGWGQVITARNEVGARLYFHRRLWFCPQGGGMRGCRGGVHACWGACVVGGGVCGCQGACMVAGGMHGCWGHAWLLGGMCGHMGGMHSCGGHVWLWGVCVVAGGGACMGYNEIRSMSGRYASYWNAFLFCPSVIHPPPPQLK